MRKFSVCIIERDAAGDRIGLDRELEGGLRIDERTDQPGAGDAIDLRPGTRHPDFTLKLRGLKARGCRRFGSGRALEPVELRFGDVRFRGVKEIDLANGAKPFP